MPGVERLSISAAVDEAGVAVALASPRGDPLRHPSHKDEEGSGAWDDEASSSSPRGSIRRPIPTCSSSPTVLCEYTSHGHCGLLRAEAARQRRLAWSCSADGDLAARAPAPTSIAPSDMMDGRVGRSAPRSDDDGLSDTPILATSAKFAFGVLRPVPEAVDSARPSAIAAATQMDPANGDEALREVLLRRPGGRRHGHGQARAALSGRPAARQGRTRLPVAAFT